MSIFCLIPAFNEKGNLEELIKRLSSFFSKHKIKYEIFFVVQGRDGSKQLLEKLKKDFPTIVFIYYPTPLGIGKAYRIGFNHIDKSYTHVLTMDADLNHDPLEITKFINEYKKGNWDVIIGSRFVPGGKFKDRRVWKRSSSFLINIFVAKMLKIKVKDLTSGFRLIKKEVIEKVVRELEEDGYPSYMEFILLSLKHGFAIKEVPIVYNPRIWGKSKMSMLKTFHDYSLFLLRIIFNF